MTSQKRPKYLYRVSEIARVCGRSYRATLRWLDRHHAVTRSRGWVYVTRERLVCQFPDIWQAMQAEEPDQ